MNHVNVKHIDVRSRHKPRDVPTDLKVLESHGTATRQIGSMVSRLVKEVKVMISYGGRIGDGGIVGLA